MTVNRHLLALHGDRAPISDHTALLIFAIPEVMEAGFATSVAIQILVENDQEIRYLAEDPTRRCWMAFVTTGPDGFEMQLTVLRSRQLEAVLDQYPVTLVLPLHTIVAKAAARRDAAKASKRRAAA